jgi:hypothetical protein
VYQNIRPIGHCWLYFFLPRVSRGDEKKNFSHFFFQNFRFEPSLFCREFYCDSKGIFEIFGHRELREKNPKNRQKTKCVQSISVSYPRAKMFIRVLNWSYLVLFGPPPSWDLLLFCVDFYRSFNDEKNAHFWGFPKNSVFLMNLFSQMCFLVVLR